MNQKFKILLVVFAIFAIMLTVTLVGVSLATLDSMQYGLNYNYIIDNFTSEPIYENGLHFIGVSNKFIKISKIPTVVQLGTIETYTSDLYKLSATATITYQLVVPTAGQFEYLRQFYIDFGDDPTKIIEPLIRN